MLGAEAAVVRAALVGLDAVLRRDLAGQAVLHLVVQRDVGADEVLADAVRRAALAEIDAAPLGDDLRRHQRQALGAEALRHAQERVVAQLSHGFLVLRRLGRGTIKLPTTPPVTMAAWTATMNPTIIACRPKPNLMAR